MNKEVFIRCRHLTKIYRKGSIEVVPLQELSLDVPKGEFLALMGPSGSGKTTLLNLIAGIDRPSSGELWIGDREISGMTRGQLTRWRATECGYIFQLYHLVPILSAYENIELPLLLRKDLSKAERRRKIDAALDIVGLSDRGDHRPSELSGGQEQRVAIARALVGDPALLVADEPTGDLDRESADSILSLLQDLSGDHGKTIVMVTHDAKAAAAASRTLHLEKGQLVESMEGGAS
ncbi:MAG: ABC transporter ATP-binding protein [Verrucomicrobiales bacterium]|nr:ABC transporter ATP-binding protein [Verrucomicrobiales bacterium]